VFHLHIMSGAVSFALFNAIEPGVAPGAAIHPVRQLLDGYLDPGYPLQFLAALFQVGRSESTSENNRGSLGVLSKSILSQTVSVD